MCALALGACNSEPVAPMPEPINAIVGATALVGRDLERVADSVVVFEGRSIVAIGPGAEISVPDGAEIFDGDGMTVMPGFIDAHVHIGFAEPAEVVARGVTTVRDLAWPPESIRPLVEASADDGFDGPTVVAAGQMLTAPGGYPTKASWAPPGTGLEVGSPDEAVAAVEAQVSLGAVVVKVALNPPVGPVLDEETLCAIVEAAHARGLEVTGHTYGVEELEKALRCGLDELAHMLMSPERIPPKTIDAMVASGLRVVPTLSIFSGRALDVATENLRAFLAAGGRIIYGTDLGNEGPQPGIDAREVRAMADAGMSAVDIIRSATVDSAAWIGIESTGYLAPGMDADLLLLRGDPVNDPSDLTSIEKVWRRGRLRGS